MKVSIREFEFEDIPLKVEWINNPGNNKYLHYDLPLEREKTEQWFEKNRNNNSRYDAVIEVDKKPIGIIGLLSINDFRKDAEFYITIGNYQFRGNNTAFRASKLLFKFGFEKLGLNKIFLTTELGNIPMQKLSEKLGFINEAQLMEYSYRNGNTYDVYYYSLYKKDFNNNICYPSKVMSDIHFLEKDSSDNNYFIKRDDLIPFSFGGNKARKAQYFFDDIIKNNYNVVITYGSKKSNHCRVISALCAKYGIKCVIISPYGDDSNNYNRMLIELTRAHIIECNIAEVSSTIDNTIQVEKSVQNQKVYFIPGGGHGNIGTEAYIDAYHEIKLWSRRNNTKFDYIFLASGTGTTQAGLVVGNAMHKDLGTNIVGISVAREERYGKRVIQKSIRDYLENDNKLNQNIIDLIEFNDTFIPRDYGMTNEQIDEQIKYMYLNHGISFNSTYTGKGYTGMVNYIENYGIKNNNILFIHTGGDPLFIDDLARFGNKLESRDGY